MKLAPGAEGVNGDGLCKPEGFFSEVSAGRGKTVNNHGDHVPESTFCHAPSTAESGLSA